jgi:hypothetical protein
MASRQVGRSTSNLIWFPQKLRQLYKYKVTAENGTVYIEL